MQSIKDSIKYTLEKKEYQLSKLEQHYSKSIEDINNFLDNTKKRSIIGLKFERLSTWYHWNFIFHFLKEKKMDLYKLSLSTSFGIESNDWDFSLGKEVAQYGEAIQFQNAIKHLAQALLLGWDKLAVQYGQLLIKMLYGKQYKGGHPVYKHPWFMLEIFCKWQNIRLDYDKLHYPEDMNVYRDVLDNWDTRDKFLLSKLVDRMAEFHIAQSSEYVITDEYGNEASADFSSSDYFIYAIEILLWLNIRSRIWSLPDYIPGNDLMRLPINDWHIKLAEIPKIELIEKAKAKLLKDYPGIEFEM
jgi:hypothetical protein